MAKKSHERTTCRITGIKFICLSCHTEHTIPFKDVNVEGWNVFKSDGNKDVVVSGVDISITCPACKAYHPDISV